jgi:hypothetical protein
MAANKRRQNTDAGKREMLRDRAATTTAESVTGCVVHVQRGRTSSGKSSDIETSSKPHLTIWSSGHTLLVD